MQHMVRRLRRPSARPADPCRQRCNPVLGHLKIVARGPGMKRVGIAAVATIMALSGPIFAQQPPAAVPTPPDFSKVEIKTTGLGDNIYMLEGQGGNITVAVAKDGIIMVDGQFAPLHDKIKAAVEAISGLPVKYLVNTHFHGDHTGGK